jgi:hypothetical protein
VRRSFLSQSGLTFFGLTLDYRGNLFRQIHEIVFHGNGGYDWETIYNMPVWLRLLTFNLLKEYHNKANNQSEQSWMEGAARDEAKLQAQRTKRVPIYNTEVSKK